jgi:hypothetical protein
MAITKQTVSLADNITERGQIHVKTITRVLEDGSLLSEAVHRKVLSPGDPLDGEGAQVAAIAAAVWMPEVIAAWQDGQEPPPAVPIEVTMRQARLALHEAGLLASVEASLNALPEPQRTAARIEWDHSQTVQRKRGLVTQLAGALGLSDAATDDLFKRAASL